MQISQIIQDVRLALGLNPTATPSLIADDSQLTIDAHIRALIPQAVAKVHLDAPPHLIDCALSLSPAIVWHPTEPCGHFVLPADFLRLVSLKMSDWSAPVTDAITCDHPLYPLQHSPYPGLRGTPSHPVAALMRRPASLTLEFYSCRTRSATLDWLLYLPYPTISSDAIPISTPLYPQLISQLTALMKNE